MSVQPSSARTVGDYTLLSLLGEGGMGVVHLARKADGPRVALKILRPHIVGDDEARRRLAREVSSLERIRSRWIAEIVDADPWAPTPYVATRYVPGLSLHDHVPEEGPIPGDDLRWFARCLAEGLAGVHGAGVLHRDVKPSNVLLEGRTPILIDFGLARVADDPKLTHPGWLLGTPGYLAPEILYGDDASTASDVHSWAATVAFAGTGHPPFGRGPAMAIMDRVRRGEHDLAGLPEDVRSIVAAALDTEPARRPSVDDLREWLSERGPAAAPPPRWEPVEEEDPFTLPLAIAAHDRADAPTWLSGAPPETPSQRFLPFPTRVLSVDGRRGPGSPDDLPVDLAANPERTGPMPGVRRGVLLSVLALGAAAAVAAWPYLATALLLLACWLLRTCTMVVTAAGDRRRLRGARWYDVLLGPLSAPWYLVLALPGAVLLDLWALGIAAAGGLVCYAAGLSLHTLLAVSGLSLALSLWIGPGSGHVRWPVRVVAQSVSRRTGRWAIATALLLGLSGVVGHEAAVHVGWSPLGAPPGVATGS